MDRNEHLRYSYIEPPSRPWTLDWFGNRRLVRDAIGRAMPHFNGAVLDIGCGEMPYKGYILQHSSKVTSYTGIDIESVHYSQCASDLVWDGSRLPITDNSFDTVLITEVLEHCPNPQGVLNEAARVLVPGGFLFLTVPFIWPFHDMPYDEYRYTPSSLRRLLRTAGFTSEQIEGTGGRHAVLAIIVGLWVRRRPITSMLERRERSLLSLLLWPLIHSLLILDKRPRILGESTLVVGLTANAKKAT